MPTSKQSPVSVHYLKARLNILKRPRVWATASGLVLSIFWVGKYLVNPQMYLGGSALESDTNPPQPTPSGNLPPQNMPASNGELFETLPDLSTGMIQPLSDAQPLQSEPFKSPLLQEFLLGRSSVIAQKDKPKSLSQSPLFSTSVENRRDPCGICGTARPSQSRSPSLSSTDSLSLKSSRAISSGTADSTVSASNGFSTVNINPLQSALDRYSSIPSPSPSSLASSLAQSLGEDSSSNSVPLATVDLIDHDARRQRESSLQGLPSPQFTPQISPFPGTTGYTLPPTLRPSSSSSSSSSPSSFQPIPGQITPRTSPATPRQVYDYGQPSSPTGQPGYPQVQPSSGPSAPISPPFSVPRAAPGHSIGGGQINTFSNP